MFDDGFVLGVLTDFGRLDAFGRRTLLLLGILGIPLLL
jgi:cell shape-determining protein MreD